MPFRLILLPITYFKRLYASSSVINSARSSVTIFAFSDLLLRDSGSAQKVIASGGHFQQNLPQGRTFHLLRLAIDPVSGLIPEISGNRLMVSIRMMQQGDDDHLQGSNDDQTLELTLCS